MHRWLAMLAVLYGLLGLWAMLHPRPRPEAAGMPPPPMDSRQGYGDALPGEAAPGHEDFRGPDAQPPADQRGEKDQRGDDGAERRGRRKDRQDHEGPRGEADQFPGRDAEAAAHHDFNDGLPELRVRPEADIQLAEDGRGGRFLRWLFSATEDPVHMLLLPIQAPGRDVGRLHLRLRAEGTQTLRLGLRLADGRVLEQIVDLDTRDWQELSLALGEFAEGGRGRMGQGQRGGRDGQGGPGAGGRRPPPREDTGQGRPPQDSNMPPPPGQFEERGQPLDFSQVVGIELRVVFPPEGGPGPERVLVELDDLRFEH